MKLSLAAGAYLPFLAARNQTIPLIKFTVQFLLHVFHLQILMSAALDLDLATPMPPAGILLDHIDVDVILGLMEMEPTVKVRLHNVTV